MPKKATTLSAPHIIDLLGNISEGKRKVHARKGEKIFTQGESAEAVFFIQSGKVKVTVVSGAGKEAVIAMLGPNDILGERALVGKSSLRAIPPRPCFLSRAVK